MLSSMQQTQDCAEAGASMVQFTVQAVQASWRNVEKLGDAPREVQWQPQRADFQQNMSFTPSAQSITVIWTMHVSWRAPTPVALTWQSNIRLRISHFPHSAPASTVIHWNWRLPSHYVQLSNIF